jgi:hypothetical protein
MNTYTMSSTLAVAKKASWRIENFLKQKKETISVINVENDKFFQKKDIDLIWLYKYKGSVYTRFIEIKADRYSHTGNYFIETVSNEQKNKPGCFLYTEADWIFYYFVDIGELNIIPVLEARKWFLENEHRFVEKELSTSKGNKVLYTSKGRLVPKEILNKEVKGVKVITLHE